MPVTGFEGMYKQADLRCPDWPDPIKSAFTLFAGFSVATTGLAQQLRACLALIFHVFDNMETYGNIEAREKYGTQSRNLRSPRANAARGEFLEDILL